MKMELFNPELGFEVRAKMRLNRIEFVNKRYPFVIVVMEEDSEGVRLTLINVLHGKDNLSYVRLKEAVVPTLSEAIRRAEMALTLAADPDIAATQI